MQSKYIIVPVLLSALVFGGTSSALAETTPVVSRESIFERIKEILTSVQQFFDHSLAQVMGTYATTGATAQLPVVTADFGVVEYYPNLKTKIGFSSNAKDSILSKAVEGDDNKLEKIGPGMICSNIEFDLEYKHPGETNAAVVETVDSAGRRTTASSPSDWLKTYETRIGDLNVPQLYQLTGAAAQYQLPVFNNTGKNVSIHPAPTDPIGNANFMAAWTASTNHSYPILWSFWNEPIHTFMGVLRTRDEFGNVVYPNETVAEFDARKILQMGSSSLAFAKLYTQHETAIRKSMNRSSQLGLASFLAGDFNPYKLTPANSVYFEAVTDTLKNKYPKAAIDFISFNNFNGAWPISFSGARTILGNRSDVGPFIVTQYSPEALKISESGAVTSTGTTRMQVAAGMLTDLAQVERAADVRSMCMSYWVGGNFGFLSEGRSGSLVENERYKTIQLFAALPTVHTKLDFGTTGLDAKGVHGLAGINQSKAAVLLWNESNVTVTVPLALNRIPNSMQSGMALSTISDVNPTIATSTYTIGNAIVLPPHGVVLLEAKALAVSDPLLRRHSIVSDSPTATRFLQTKSTTDRVPFACTDVTKLPNKATCVKNTGTYGFYDSVRSVAYLGRGEGMTAASVTATYESLPSKLYINPLIFAQTGVAIATSALPVSVTATFPTCGTTVKADFDAASGYVVLDLSAAKVNPPCRNGKSAVLTFSMSGTVMTGTQAEIYVSSNGVEAAALAQNNRMVTYRATTIDTNEHLVVEPFFKAMTGENHQVIEPMRVKAIVACPKGVVTCPVVPFGGALVLLDDTDTPVATFTASVDGTIVKALRGKYTIMTALVAGNPNPPVNCRAVVGEIQTSKGVTNDVTVACPVK